MVKVVEGQTIKVPDGTYNGNYSGYIVTFQHDNKDYDIQMMFGMKSPECPVEVTIVNQSPTIKLT